VWILQSNTLFLCRELLFFILSPAKITHFLGGSRSFLLLRAAMPRMRTSLSYSLWPWWWSQQTSSETPARQSAARRWSHFKLGPTGLILLLSYKRFWHHAAAAFLANRLERISPSKIKCIPLLCCLMTLWIYGIICRLWRMSKCIRSICGMIMIGGKWSAWRQHSPSTTLSTTNPSWSVMWSNSLCPRLKAHK
jgi:hypothetical protein